MADPKVLIERLELLHKLNRNLTTYFDNEKYDDFINYNQELINSTTQELKDAGVYVYGNF